MLLIAVYISLLSLGFRAITDKNMIFYFLRSGLDKIIEGNEYLKERADHHANAGNDDIANHVRSGIRFTWLTYIAKPIILCATCMASVHTLIWYNFFTDSFDFNVVPVMLIVAILNTFGWGIIELIWKSKK